MIKKYCFPLVLFLSACGDPSAQENTALEGRFDPIKQDYAFVIPHNNTLAGSPGIKAKDCKTCHVDFFNEWQRSTHASAIKDLQFQAELAKADSPKWMCLNCHIPMQNQRETIVTHLKDHDVMQPVSRPNPDYDPQLQQEAITCATCHIRTDHSTDESYVIGVFGSALSPHPVKKDLSFLHNTCQRCHNPQGEGITPNLICWFETTKESSEAKSEKSCVDCHMPVKRRRLVAGDSTLPIRETRQHHWVGSGVPKSKDGYDDLLDRGYVSGLEVTIKEVHRKGTGLSLSLDLYNRNSGHYLPTADPERFILILAELQNQKGERLDLKKYRIGQTWEWSPAKKIADNRLRTGERRQWDAKFRETDKGDKLIVQALHVRLTTNNANHMRQANGLNEKLFPESNALVKEIEKHYPFASVIFREEVQLETGVRRQFSPEELVQLSLLEMQKEDKERDY